MFLTSAIETEEKRCVLTLDVPNAFIQTDLPSLDSDGDRTIMKIEGPMVLLLQKIEPGFYDEYIASSFFVVVASSSSSTSTHICVEYRV